MKTPSALHVFKNLFFSSFIKKEKNKNLQWYELTIQKSMKILIGTIIFQMKYLKYQFRNILIFEKIFI